MFRQNQWEVTAGGPMWIPKVFNGKDKLFCFFTYKGHKNSEPAPTYTTVPTGAQRNGDFSELLKLGTNYTLYDPASAVLSGSTVTRQPFSNNVVPQNRMNPIATNYLKYIGLPNYPGKADGTNNYFAGLTTNNSYSSFSGRLDVNISNANKLTGSVRESYWIQKSGSIFDNIALGENGIRSYTLSPRPWWPTSAWASTGIAPIMSRIRTATTPPNGDSRLTSPRTKVSSTTNTPRLIQFALRLTF